MTENPYQSLIQPIALSQDCQIQFDCHKGIACFNPCGKDIEPGKFLPAPDQAE
jgi:hypothetical protein